MTTRVRAKTPQKKPAKDRPARLVLRFDSCVLRDEFRGWLSDGGGEQAFVADLEYFTDSRLRGADFDYDGDTVIVKGIV